MPKEFDLQSVLAPVERIVGRLRKRRDELTAEIELIDSQITRFDGIGTGGKARKQETQEAEPASTRKKRRRGKRIRRSREEIEALANEVVEFIKAKGKDGVSGTDIKARFGDLFPSVNAWLKNYSKAKVKTTGIKSKMKYFA